VALTTDGQDENRLQLQNFASTISNFSLVSRKKDELSSEKMLLTLKSIVKESIILPLVIASRRFTQYR